MQRPEDASSQALDLQSGRVARNALWLGGSEFLSRLIGLGIAVYLARALGTEGYGLLGSALAFVSYFIIFVAAGVEFHGVRDIAQHPEQLPVIVGHVVGMRLLLVLVSLVLMALLMFMLPPAVFGRIDLALIYALTLLTLALNTTWALRGLQQMRSIAAGLVVQNVLMAAATFLLVRSPQPDLWLIPAIQVVSELFLIAWYYRCLQVRFGRITPVLEWRALLPTLKETARVSLGRFPRVFYYQGDILLLAWLAGAASAGEFLASHKIIVSIVMVGVILEMNAFPVVSRLAASSPFGALRFQMNLLRYALIAMAPLVVLGAAYAVPLIDLIYGGEFAASAAVFSWMLLTVPVFEASIVMQDVLIATRKSGGFIVANMAAMSVHILVGIAVIPGYGGTGAALACLAGELIGLALLTAFVWRSSGQFPYSWRMLAPIAGSVPMYAVIQSTPQWPDAARMALGLLSYAALAALLGALTRQEMTRIWNQLRRFVNFGADRR